MKVDKRHKMYGVENANFCTSMPATWYNKVRHMLTEEFGPSMQCFLALSKAGNRYHIPKTNKWYLENVEGYVTVYFPREEDITFVEHCRTMALLK